MIRLTVVKILLVFVLAPCAALLKTSALDQVHIEVLEDKIQSNLTGVWQFNIPKGKKLYKEGALFISKGDEDFTVTLNIENGSLTGYDIFVVDNKINFNVNLDGVERASFVLILENEQLVGEMYSQNFNSEVIAKRKFPKK